MTGNPRSLLFLSCDIVGSTQFKQRAGSAWQSTFLHFYRQYPQELAKQAKLADFEPTFELWKPVGDELIFTVRVQHETDVFQAVRVWLNTMDAYEQDALVKDGLATKGGAFIATFPSPDSESTVPRFPTVEDSDTDVLTLNEAALSAVPRDHGNYLFDYFGPSIDTGFRIFSCCSRRYFTLSIEVVWAVQRAHTDEPNELTVGDLVSLGERQLKGVWADRDYPLFALDRQHKEAVNTALREMNGNAPDLTKVGAVARACVESDGWPSRVYLPHSGFQPFTQPPASPSGEHFPLSSGGDMSGVEVEAPDSAGGDALPTDAPMG